MTWKPFKGFAGWWQIKHSDSGKVHDQLYLSKKSAKEAADKKNTAKKLKEDAPTNNTSGIAGIRQDLDSTGPVVNRKRKKLKSFSMFIRRKLPS